jgi:hypothetical protein
LTAWADFVTGKIDGASRTDQAGRGVILKPVEIEGRV